MKALLIDDHPMLNAGIVSILESTGLFASCVQAQSLSQAMSVIGNAETMPSLVILDLLLGEENGLDFLAMLENHCKARKLQKPPVLVCSAIADSLKVRSALKLGASGFLSKTGGRDELLEAVAAVLGGKTYVSKELDVKLAENSGLYAKFTKQELVVIDLVKRNKTNKQIADALFISIRTVENYISRIYFKTGFASREELRGM
ncbi:MAG: response regulator transcription factor [Treponema sp.]|nr:response regulator transcription factor [Treponema sp.]